MNDKILDRFETLLNEGEKLVRALPKSGGSADQRPPAEKEPIYRSWLMSSVNLIQTITIPGSFFVQECERILGDKGLVYFVPTRLAQQMYGLLKAARNEWDCGTLRKIEFIVAAVTFDDFLDHAALYHKANKKIEASVLASAVLEDTVKKIASKNGMNPSGYSLEELVDEMVKSGIFTPIKAKRIKGCSGVRNSALHAEWDKFDIRDAGQLISGTRELIEEFL